MVRRRAEHEPYWWRRVVSGSGGTQLSLLGLRSLTTSALSRNWTPLRVATSTIRAPQMAALAFHFTLEITVQDLRTERAL